MRRPIPSGRTTSYAYDALNRPFQTLNVAIQAQPLVQYGYTPNGKSASLTDGHVPSGNITAFAYDGLDRLSTTTWSDSTTEVLGYDADSNVLTRKTRAGRTITLTYDTLNRLSTRAATGEATVTYTYDLAGRAIGVSDNSAALVVPSASSGPIATVYAYAGGNPVSFRDPSGNCAGDCGLGIPAPTANPGAGLGWPGPNPLDASATPPTAPTQTATNNAESASSDIQLASV